MVGTAVEAIAEVAMGAIGALTAKETKPSGMKTQKKIISNKMINKEDNRI